MTAKPFKQASRSSHPRGLHNLVSVAASVAAAPIVPMHQWLQKNEGIAQSGGPYLSRLSTTPPHQYVHTAASHLEPTSLNTATTIAQPKSQPLYVQPVSSPTTMNTSISVFKEFLITLRDASDMFLPLKTALVGFLAVWDVYDRTVDVQKDFIELGSKFSALNNIVVAHTGKRPGNPNLQERLEAIATAVSQLSEAITGKQQRGALKRAAQSMGDVTVVSIMFRRVTSLLEAFQLESQIRAETLLDTILERLDTTEQHNLTSVDAVQIITAHMNKQYSSALEMSKEILEQLEAAGGSESVTNNNSNRNEVEGLADLDNNNANETELETDERGGGGVMNTNSNDNRVSGGWGFSPGENGAGGHNASHGYLGRVGAPWPRTRIANNNSNKNVVRRFAGTRKTRLDETKTEH